MEKKDLESRIEGLKLALKITVDKQTVQDAKEYLAYHILLYKVKTGKNYYGKNIR